MSVAEKVICIPIPLYMVVEQLVSSLVKGNYGSIDMVDPLICEDSTMAYYSPKVIELVIKYLLTLEGWSIALNGETIRSRHKVYRCLSIPVNIPNVMLKDLATQLRVYVLGPNSMLVDPRNVSRFERYSYRVLPTPKLLCGVSRLVSLGCAVPQKIETIPSGIANAIRTRLRTMSIVCRDIRNRPKIRAQLDGARIPVDPKPNPRMLNLSKIPCDKLTDCDCNRCLVPRSIDKPCCKCGAILPWEDIIPLGYTYDYKVACKPCYQRDLEIGMRAIFNTP